MATEEGLIREAGITALGNSVLTTLPLAAIRRARGSNIGVRNEERSPPRMAVGRHAADGGGGGGPLAGALEVTEEESAVADDPAAENAPILVLLKARHDADRQRW